MAESQKGATPTSDSNRKVSLLDEDFGKEFFSSWKTMSVTEDDGMDFSCETAPKGMKKNFNFDKLDMDFVLDGDFGKISSFKVDMSGLDFSSPKSKERAEKESIDAKLDRDFGKISSLKVDMSGLDFSSPKSKGRAEKESIDGKLEAKKDHFNFSFDFKELDSFDLDSSLMKGKQKTEKCTDDKGFESSIRHEKDKVSRSDLAIEANEFRENNVMTDSVTTSNSKGLLDGLGDFGSITTGAPRSAKFETVNASGSATSSQDENVNNRQEETNQPSPHSTKSSDQQPIQDSFGQTVSFDPRQESVAELQVVFHSLEAPLDTNPGLLSTKCEIEKRLESQIQVPMGTISGDEAVPGNAGGEAKGFQSTINEFQKKLENQNHIPMINVSGHESALENANSVDVSTATLLPKVQNTKADSMSQSLLAPVQSEPRADKVMQIEEQGHGATHLTLLIGAQEKVSWSHPTLTTMETLSLRQKRKESGHLSPTDKKRLELHSDAQGGHQNLGTSSPKDGTITKGVPLIKESQKNDNAHGLSGPSEPRADKVMQIEEQGNGATRLTLLSRGQEKDSRSHPTLITMETHSLRQKRKESEHLSPTDQRVEFNSDAQGGHQNVGTSSPKDGTVTKVVPLIKESKKNDNAHGLSGPSSQVRDSSSHEKAAKFKPLNINPKLLVPRINSNSISVERNELSSLKNGNKISNATSLKFTRVVTSKNDPSVSAPQKELKSLRNSNGTMGMHLDLANLKKQSISSEKQKMLSPSLKRKTFEEPTAYPVMEYPLKRTTERPNHCRKAREVSQQIDENQVHNHENHGCDKDVHFDHPMLNKSDTPEEVPLSELQVPIVMEDDENVKKAETCRKELEDMCNMLKKKHEEAKELLVRAVVNNNNLLMLNHPMYEEKIRTILKFSASLRSKELQS